MTEVAEVLRRHGALSRVPDFSTIRIGREGVDRAEEVFREDTNSPNHFTLFETLARYYLNQPSPIAAPAAAGGGSFPFPDLSRIRILRPVKDKLAERNEIPVRFLTVSNTFDCAKDLPIQFGDQLDVPEREHGFTEQPVGLTPSQADSLKKCLSRKVTFKVKDQSIELGLAGTGAYLAQAIRQPAAEQLLTSSSDLSRVKVHRRAAEAQAKEITENVESFWKNQKPFSDDLWLRDGDVVHLVARRLMDHSALLGPLETASRDFH